MDDFIRNSDPRVVAALLALVVVLSVMVEVKYLLWPQVAQDVAEAVEILIG